MRGGQRGSKFEVGDACTSHHGDAPYEAQQLSFAMELQIPQGSPRGQTHLDWLPYPGPVPLKVDTPASRLVHIS